MDGRGGEKGEESASKGGVLREDGLVSKKVNVVGYVLVAVGRGYWAGLGGGGVGGG